MTGSHEVRGSIPLGSTNTFNKLGHPLRMPFVFVQLLPPALMRSRLAFERPNQPGKTEHYRYYRDHEVERGAAADAAYSPGGDH